MSYCIKVKVWIDVKNPVELTSQFNIFELYWIDNIVISIYWGDFTQVTKTAAANLQYS